MNFQQYFELILHNHQVFLNDLDMVLGRAAENNVGYLLCVGVELDKFERIKALTETYSHVFSSVGTHPNSDCSRSGEPQADQLVEFSRDRAVVAIGETGLDYFRSKGDLAWQRDRFRAHIRAAKIANLPLIVHSRNAKKDTIQILKSEGADECGGVMHCFTEDWEMAEKAIDLGFHISFSFNSSEEISLVLPILLQEKHAKIVKK